MKIFFFILLLFSLLSAKISERELNNFAQQIINSKNINISTTTKDKLISLQKSFPKLLQIIKNKKTNNVNKYLAFKKLVALAKILSNKNSKDSIIIYKEIFKIISSLNFKELSYLNLLLNSLKNSNLNALNKEEKEYLASSLKKFILNREKILKIIKDKQDKDIEGFIKLMKFKPTNRPKYINYLIEDYKSRKNKNFKALKNVVSHGNLKTYFETLKKIPKLKGKENIFQKIKKYWCFFKIEHFDSLDKKEYLECFHTVFKRLDSFTNEQQLLVGIYMVYIKLNTNILEIIHSLNKEQ